MRAATPGRMSTRHRLGLVALLLPLSACTYLQLPVVPMPGQLTIPAQGRDTELALAMGSARNSAAGMDVSPGGGLVGDASERSSPHGWGYTSLTLSRIVDGLGFQ